MLNFLSKIFKHNTPRGTKKIIFFVFLFIAICFSLLYIPRIVKAQYDPNSLNALTSHGTMTQVQTVDKCAIARDKLSYGQQFAAALVDIIAALPKAFADTIVKIDSFIMSTVLNWPITNPKAGTGSGQGAAQAFASGWATTRDLGNMLIVLGFVIVGIATALRIREYEAKKFLGKLIIVALLVNFSGLFCGLIIDGSNITMNGLMNLSNATSGGTASTQSTTALKDMGTTFFEAVQASEKDTACKALENGSVGDYAAIKFGFTDVYLVIALALLYLAIILFARYAVLGILFILSPLAFVFFGFPFPKAKDLWNKWWEHFLKWSFMGVSVTFFLGIAANMLKNFPIGPKYPGADIITIFEYVAITLMVIVVGLWISSKQNGVAALAAGAVMGLAAGGAGLAMGAIAGGAKGGAKMLNKATGGFVTEKAQQFNSGVGRAMENLGLRDIGVTADKNKKQVESKAASMSDEYTAAKAAAAAGDKSGASRVEAIQKLARTGRGAQGAAAMKVISEAKDFNDTFAQRDATGKVVRDADGKSTMNMSQVAGRMSYAEAAGATGVREKAEKLDPRLKAYNQTAIAKHGSAAAAVADGFSGAGVADIREFSEDTLKDPAFINNTSGKKISEAARYMSDSKVKAIKSHIENLGNQQEAAAKKGDKAKSKELIDKWAEISTL